MVYHRLLPATGWRAMPLKPDCVASTGHAKSMMKLD
jgi:hypothetical protein